MTAEKRSVNRGVVWAIGGGVVLVLGVVAIIAGSLATSHPSTEPPSSSTSPASVSPSPSGTARGGVVDASVSSKGWVPEPITTDPDAYIRAALSAAATFDTRKATREQWLDYLESWFTPDTRYTSPTDQASQMQAAKVEMRQSVVLPESDWDSLAAENGRVMATVTGKIAYTPVPDDGSGDMRIGTATVVLHYTRTGEGGTSSYDESSRVSVQVLCGPGSVPTPGSAQRAGDCKVVRFFTQAMEP